MTNIKLSEQSTAEIKPFESFEQLAGLTVDLLKSETVAVSGGNTFAKLYDLWLGLNPDCKETYFYPVDERMVPFNDKDSNWGAAYEKFYKPVGREDVKNNFTPDVERSLDILGQRFGKTIPVFDVIFLGVGDDGHTASLFPGGDYLNDLDSIVLQTISPKPPFDRVTIGPAVIKNASHVITIIAGEAKKPIMQGIKSADISLPIVKMLSLRKKSEIFVENRLLKALIQSTNEGLEKW